MDIQRIQQYKASFNSIGLLIKSDDGPDEFEVCFARDLQPNLGYARWEDFQVALARAVESCKTDVHQRGREV